MSNRITLQSAFSADAGGMKNVSLITTGIEAAGHGVFLDEGTAETASKALLGKPIKSYLRHAGAGGDRLGQEIGFFDGIYRAGNQIKAAAFHFFDSFRKDSGAIADKLIEMAQRVPDAFGVSLVLEYNPVWVMADGSEMLATGPDAPAGALRGIPSMRVLSVVSADFVDRPAANPNGLLSVDGANKGEATKAMSEVTTLSIADHETKVAELSAKHAAALSELTAKNESLVKERDALTAALAAKDVEHKAALEAKIAEVSKPLNEKIAELETFDARKLGVAPVAVRSAQIKEMSRALDTPEKKLAHFEKMPAGAERDAFRRKHYDEMILAQNARAKGAAQ